jgi:hypothetical protein
MKTVNGEIYGAYVKIGDSYVTMGTSNRKTKTKNKESSKTFVKDFDES